MKINHLLSLALAITLISILTGCSGSTATETVAQTQTITQDQTQVQTETTTITPTATMGTFTKILTVTQIKTITPSDITKTVDQTVTITTIPTTTNGPIPTSSPIPTSETSTFSSPVPTTTTNTENIDFTDSTGDTFDDTGKPIQVEPYFDIVSAEVHLIGTNYLFKMKVNGEVPSVFTNPNIAAEWDFFIDSDHMGATGNVNPLFVNDIGAEYIIRLLIHGTQIRTELINLNTLESSSIAYTVDGDTISLSFNWTLMQQLQNFDCVALTRSWFNNSLIAADKAPNEGHHSFSA